MTRLLILDTDLVVLEGEVAPVETPPSGPKPGMQRERLDTVLGRVPGPHVSLDTAAAPDRACGVAGNRLANRRSAEQVEPHAAQAEQTQ